MQVKAPHTLFKWALALSALSPTEQSAAQELVVNGGFEEQRRCPKTISDKTWHKARDVAAPRGRPGYFHACSDAMGVPHNWAGRQHAAEGEAYMGLVLTADRGGDQSMREFIQLPLHEPLVNGRKYRFSMKVSLADRSGYFTDRIGACFTTDGRRRRGIADLIGRAGVDNAPDRFLSDTSGWMEVTGIYSATGGERFVTIGNFQAWNQTSRKALVSNKGGGVLRNVKARNALDLDPDRTRAMRRKLLARQAYYYVDAVSLVPIAGFDSIHKPDPELACPTTTPPPLGPELVPDPGFDTNTSGPRAVWKNASGGTPDFFNGVTGIYLHSAVNHDHREFIRTELKERLDPCSTYRFSLRIRRDPSYAYAVDRIGVALVDTFTFDRRRGLPDHDAQWSTPQGMLMEDTGAMLELCGHIENAGCARTMLIGNFLSDTATTIMRINERGGPFAYYFIDDVSLRRTGTRDGCSLVCDHPLVDLAQEAREEQARDPMEDLPANLHFDVAGHVPQGDLDRIAGIVLRMLHDTPAQRFVIAGHTDATGSGASNRRLSERRAKEVRDGLLARGVPTEALITEHHGSNRPIADNDSEEGRALNRRVEIQPLDP